LKFWPLVWAALWRRPAESTLLWLAVTVAFLVFGFTMGLHQTYRELIGRSRSDRLYINARFNWSDRLPLAMKGELTHIAGVTAASGGEVLCGYHVMRTNTACVFFADDSMPLARAELAVTPAQWDRLFAARDGVLVSESAARRWDLHEGGTFNLVTSPGSRVDGAVDWHLKVLAIVHDDLSFWNGNFIFGNLQYLESVRPYGQRGRVGVYNVAVRDDAQADAIARSIDRRFANSGNPTISVSGRADAEQLAHSSVDMASMTWIIAGAGLVMVLFLVANGLARSVRERLPEFAVLKTVGFADWGIVALVFCEAAIPCVTGALLGTALAAIFARSVLQFLPRDITVLPLPTVSVAVYVGAVGFALLLALVSSAAPVARLRRLALAATLVGE